MLTRRTTTLSRLATAAAASLVLIAGCASPPPVAEKLVMDPMGTVTTYHRKSSGVGPEIFVFSQRSVVVPAL